MDALGQAESSYISVNSCVVALCSTIITFLGLFLSNKFVWRRYEKLDLNDAKREIILIPCNKGIYNSASLYLINLLTTFHLLIIPIIVYDTVFSSGDGFPENWRRNAIVFLIEYSTSLLICLSRKLFCRIDTCLVLPSGFDKCNHVFVLVKKDIEKANYSGIMKDRRSLTYRVGKVISLKFKELTDSLVNSSIKGYDFYSCSVFKNESSGMSYFTFGIARYVYSSESKMFSLQMQFEDLTALDLTKTIENGGLTKDLVKRYLSVYGENVNEEDSMSLLDIVGGKLFTITFLLQYLMLLTTFFLKFFTWSLCWSGLILYTNIYCIVIDFINGRKVKKEKEIAKNRRYRVKRESKISLVESKYLVPLDIVIINAGEIVPCDVILTNGSALVDESNLTGESVPVLKRSLNLNFLPSGKFELDNNSRKEFMLHTGSKVLKVYNNSNFGELSNDLTCIVLKTGIFTNSSRIMSGISYNNEGDIAKAVKSDSNEFHYDLPLLWTSMTIISAVVIVFQVLISPFCIGSIFFILGTFMQLLPIWAPTTVLSTINVSTNRLKKNFDISSFFPNRLLFASKLQVLFFDKTGTLTSPEHTLFHVERLNEKILEDNGLANGGLDILKVGISTCHSLNCDPDDPNNCFGDEIDREMLRYTNSTLYQERVSEQEKMVYVFNRDRKKASSEVRKGMCFRVLKVFGFNSASRCMTVIVRCENSGRVFVFSKGAPETIIGFCNKLYVGQNLADLTSYYSSNGSYVLIIGFRELNFSNECFTEKYLSLIDNNRRIYEQALIPIGILCFSNSIRNEARCVISQIKDLGIQPIVLTGDNSHCALTVAKKVGIVNGNVSLIKPKGINIDVLNVKEDDLFSLRMNILSEYEEIVILAYVSDSGNLVFEDEFKNLVSVHDIINNLSNIRIVCTYEAFLYMDSKAPPCVENKRESDSMFNCNNTLLDLVLKSIVVISRSTHLDKLKVVERLINTGRVVGMVGDGSNDIAAIKRSNIGILMNDINANAHFVIGKKDLIGVINIICEACNCASISRSLYLFMIMYGITIVICKNILLYYSQATLPVMGYFTYSILINFPSVWALKRSRPARKIKNYPVNSELVSKSTLTIIVGFVLIIGVNLALLLFSLSKKSWFVSSYFKNVEIPIHLFARQDGFEPATVIIWMCSLHSHMALVFGFGGTHREPFYKNTWLMIAWILPQIGIFTVLFSNPSFLTCLFKVNCDESITPSSAFFAKVHKFTGNNVFPLSWKLELTSWILVSFLLCILVFKVSNLGHKN
ncbi:P-type ATpase 3 [Cryptosporidium ryanae]|uniref:P-type ATpase 3 n=1 Tax=Cryptosporidium ryanae TaxID=515981 RepID=UPI00351A1322|nr:P-type ATpase 3 [Cryptosporidium ryanae]